MNVLIIRGRLTKEWETKFVPNTDLVSIKNTVAVDRYMGKDKDKKTDFIPVQMVGKRAETLCQYTTKGDMVLFKGNLCIDTYDKDGEKKSFTRMNVEDFDLIQPKKSNNSVDDNMTPADDGDIPF